MSADEEVTEEEYQEALKALQSTISGKTRAAPKGPNDLTWEQQFERLNEYLERLGMTESTNALSVIHVAGTKGKGSTCAFVEHVLRENGTRTGLYSSPHLVDIRERFRIDGVPVSKTVFVRNFWWMFNALKETGCEADLGMPAYFRFLTLLGFRIFAQERVDAVVLEVGLGGRLDATNVVKRPVVLGDTIAKIAREKAGIFKTGVPAYTSPQPDDAMESLFTVAGEVGAPLSRVDPIESYEGENVGGPVALGLAGAHQKLNAALALKLLRVWAEKTPSPPAWGPAAEEDLAAGRLPATWRAGLAKTEWWGRAQIVTDETAVEAAEAEAGGVIGGAGGGDGGGAGGAQSSSSNLLFYLDGAHTEESMRQCAEWFCAATKRDSTSSSSQQQHHHHHQHQHPASSAPLRLLLFNCMEERDPKLLLTPLVLAEQDAPLNQPAMFAPSESSSKGLVPFAGPMENTAWQAGLARTWDELARKHAGCSAVTQAGADSGGGGSGGGGGGGDSTEGGSREVSAAAAGAPSGASFESAAGAAAGVVVPCLRQAVGLIRSRAAEERRLKSGRRVHVLVTGSLYLVGDMLRLLGRAG